MIKIEELWQKRQFNPTTKQKEAILHVDGPLYITAGPGSGKTRVLLWRTAFELTPHKSKVNGQLDLSESENLMLQDYLLHILQYGTPEERFKILAGIQSKFELNQRRLELKK